MSANDEIARAKVERFEHRLATIGVALVVLAGLFLRVWSIARTPIDADTATVGLMAREILHGHFFAFYWGQSYGGVEPYFVAFLFALFGQSTLTLGLAPLLLDALAAVLVWRIGRRVFSATAGVIAALLFWVWPEVYVRQSTIEHGFRFAALDIGLGIVLIALRRSESGTLGRWHTFEWTVFGALCGVGFWSSPEIVYFLIPAFALLAWRGVHRRVALKLSDVIGAVVAAIIGALPWLWDNVGKGYPSFRHSVQPNPPGSPFGNHLRVFFGHMLPMILGMRIRVSGRWLFSPVPGQLLYAVAIVAMIGWLLVLVVRRRGLVVVAFLLVFPLVYAYSPFTWYWQDGRYALYFAPMLALFVAAGVDEVGVRIAALLHRGFAVRAATATAAVLAGLGLTLAAATYLAPYVPVNFAPLGRSGWFTMQTDPTGYDAKLAATLERDHIHDLYAGYWLAYPLAFESRGGLVASDVRYDRYRSYLQTIEKSSDPAWLFVNPTNIRAAKTLVGVAVLNPGCATLNDPCLTLAELESWLALQHISYRIDKITYFEAIVPSKYLDPDAVFAHFDIPTTFN